MDDIVSRSSLGSTSVGHPTDRRPMHVHRTSDRPPTDVQLLRWMSGGIPTDVRRTSGPDQKLPHEAAKVQFLLRLKIKTQQSPLHVPAATKLTSKIWLTDVDVRGRTWTYVDVRGRTWTYVDVRRRTSTYVDIRRRTSTYVDVPRPSVASVLVNGIFKLQQLNC